MERSSRNIIQTETEEEQMSHTARTENDGDRENDVGSTRECENTSNTCNNDIHYKSSRTEVHCQESACEDTKSAESIVDNITERKSLRKRDKRVNEKEKTQCTRSIAIGVITEDLLTVPGGSQAKTGICSKDTGVDNYTGDETNGNMLDSLESKLNDTNPTSVNQVCEYKGETTKRTLSNTQAVNCHREEKVRMKQQADNYLPTKNCCFKNQLCRNKNPGDMPSEDIKAESVDYQNKSDTYHSSMFAHKIGDVNCETSCDLRRMKNDKNDSLGLHTYNAACSPRVKKTGTELHVASSAYGETEIKIRMNTSGDNLQRVSKFQAVTGHFTFFGINDLIFV